MRVRGADLVPQRSSAGPRPVRFVLYPAELPAPEQPVVGAEALHRMLMGWERLLAAGGATQQPAVAPEPVAQR
jgi:hypothetical protein